VIRLIALRSCRSGRPKWLQFDTAEVGREPEVGCRSALSYGCALRADGGGGGFGGDGAAAGDELRHAYAEADERGGDAIAQSCGTLNAALWGDV